MTLYDSMVESYAPKSAAERVAVQQEVMQLIALAGLARGGFFEKAAFYGGTCLHLFYGMERFSEDMDFSLLAPDPSFDFESYFPAIKEEFALAGKEVEIQLKHKGRPSSVESAFLKESAEVFRIGFTTQKQIKVKIEVDIDPPPGFSTWEATGLIGLRMRMSGKFEFETSSSREFEREIVVTSRSFSETARIWSWSRCRAAIYGIILSP